MLTPVDRSWPAILTGDSDRLEQPLGQGARIALGRASLDEDRELVPAEPGDRVAGTDAAAQGIGNGDEHLVARVMAVVVVDGLEVVEVQEEGRDALVALGQRMLQPGREERSVRQPGERVVQRPMLELLLEALPLV